ncbi:protein-glutamate O-methyltransferase CheR [Pseudanabaena sp. FACHB-2040]|uniref:CheR family methyltransferase n=1 Tax=Pseudanabaena sp. FACHB-2040 TaxID=2692859 RepID=UPI00168915A2|nr:protein-glutamate O-methyltransferase CheR [Pseudanabaena sp. FACHB-2040]MBD2256864.1 protein-glutamate O-methyltransferase CheR [Pseudanabaena sp. FACHB-2040]
MQTISYANSITPSLEAIELEDLLSYLKQVEQIDLTGYKRSTLMRRIQVRMQRAGAKNYQDYLGHLKQPGEIIGLLNTIFINFTSFFRDRFVWKYLEDQVIPQLIADRSPDEPIRVWSAGCASGEETYSLAMLLAEALGAEQYQQRVQIYGTDIDQGAITHARRGRYFPHSVKEISPDLLERYFECTADGYQWRRDRGHDIVFHHHNLLQASPLTQIDLLVCRNVFIYLMPEAQTRILANFRFSLKQSGLLMLGQAENIITRPQRALFTAVDRQAKAFKKAPDLEPDHRLQMFPTLDFALAN